MSKDSFIFGINTTIAITIAIGFIGQVFSIIIFSKKTFRNNSISTYCIALSVNELFALLKFATNIGNIAFNANIIDQSDALCKLLSYIPVVYFAVQPCIMVAFSIDKLLSMKMNSIAMLKKKWFQWSVVFGLVLFNILLYLVMPILIKRRNIAAVGFICDATTIGFFSTFMIMVVLETCIIPFIIMITSSILTIRLLIKSRKSVERNGNLANQDRKSRDRKYAVSSVAFNVMFLFFKTPITIYYILLAFYYYHDVYFYNIAVLLDYLNSSSFFFIHLVTNSLFRREFLALIRLDKRNGENSSNTTKRVFALNRINPS